MRKTTAIIAVVSLVFAWDLRNPTSHPEAQKGAQWGERAKSQYKSERGDKSNTKTKLMDPATQQNKLYVGPDGAQHNAPQMLCGQGGVKDGKVFARVSLSTTSLSFYYASNPYSGSLDRSFTVNGRYLCFGGACNYFDSYTKTFTYCTKYSISGGTVSSQSVSTLDGCVDLNNQGQLPSYFAGPWISELMQYYQSIGKPITQSKIEENYGNSVYYGGKVENCSGVSSNPPQTQYLNNPYVMNDQALYYYLSCDPANDPTCKATKVTKAVSDDPFRTNVYACVVERQVGGPQTEEGTNGRICTPGQRLYPDGYNDTSVACFSGDRFFDFSSYFWLECNADGKGFTLKGWGYWEGAPCGTAGSFPPTPQVQIPYPFNQNVTQVEVGRLSVNRRRGGEGLSNGDCVSNEPTPYKVLLTNTYYPSMVPKNVLEIRVQNASACNYFRWSNVSQLVSETINNSCSSYEQQGCKVMNEWWEDANGQRYQVIKNSEPVAQLSGCVEILRDETYKTWTSSQQTNQAPPQNCNFPPKTCKTVGGKTECRQWWRKIREYKCATTGAQKNYNLLRVDAMMRTLDWDRNSGQMSFTFTPCTPGQCYSVSRMETRFQCSATGNQYQDQPSCSNACYEQAPPRCPSSYTYNYNNGRCEATPSCSVGTYNTSRHRCEAPFTCPPGGSVFDPNLGMCLCGYCYTGYAAEGGCVYEYYGYDYIACAWGGIYNCYDYRHYYNRYYHSVWCAIIFAAPPECPSGMTFDPANRVCYRSASCPSGGTLDTTSNLCKAAPFCPSGWTMSGELANNVVCKRSSSCFPVGVSLEKYVCDKTSVEYNTQPECKNACSTPDCPAQGVNRNVGIAGQAPNCQNGEKYCVVKVNKGGDKVDYDVLQCSGSGNTWTCPVGSGVLVEDCKCGDEMKMSFGIAAGTLNAIYQVLHDRSCK